MLRLHRGLFLLRLFLAKSFDDFAGGSLPGFVASFISSPSSDLRSRGAANSRKLRIQIRIFRQIGQAVDVGDLAVEEFSHKERLGQAGPAKILALGAALELARAGRREDPGGGLKDPNPK